MQVEHPDWLNVSPQLLNSIESWQVDPLRVSEGKEQWEGTILGSEDCQGTTCESEGAKALEVRMKGWLAGETPADTKD